MLTWCVGGGGGGGTGNPDVTDRAVITDEKHGVAVQRTIDVILQHTHSSTIHLQDGSESKLLYCGRYFKV